MILISILFRRGNQLTADKAIADLERQGSHILYTLQSKQRYEKMLATGRLRGDGRSVNWLYRMAYRCLTDHARKHFDKPTFPTYPVWAWYWPKPTPTTCTKYWWGNIDEYVVIEFEADRSKFIPSDWEVFDYCHCGGYVPDSQADWDRWANLPYETEADELASAAEAEASWYKVFDLNWRRNTDFAPLKTDGKKPYQLRIQVIMSEIRLEAVRKVTHFKR